MALVRGSVIVQPMAGLTYAEVLGRPDKAHYGRCRWCGGTTKAAYFRKGIGLKSHEKSCRKRTLRHDRGRPRHRRRGNVDGLVPGRTPILWTIRPT